MLCGLRLTAHICSHPCVTQQSLECWQRQQPHLRVPGLSKAGLCLVALVSSHTALTPAPLLPPTPPLPTVSPPTPRNPRSSQFISHRPDPRTPAPHPCPLSLLPRPGTPGHSTCPSRTVASPTSPPPPVFNLCVHGGGGEALSRCPGPQGPQQMSHFWASVVFGRLLQRMG